MKIFLTTLLLCLILFAGGCSKTKPEETPVWRPTTVTVRAVLEKMPATLEQFKQSNKGQMPTDLMELGFGMDKTCITCRTHPLIEGYVFEYRYDGCWKVEAIPRSSRTARTLVINCLGEVHEEQR